MLTKLWYSRHPVMWLFLPLSLIYCCVAFICRLYGLYIKRKPISVPVIVVGNLTVGGVGKTPLVVAMVKRFQTKGLCVGVVSRGYGATLKTFPYQVKLNDSALCVGDEPLLIAQHTQAPVVIAPKRCDAIDYLLKHHACDVIISDDGLQHYAMDRAVEIVVIDGVRGLGNGLCLPAGPLREGPWRLKTVDFIITHGAAPKQGTYRMDLLPGTVQPLIQGAPFDPNTTVAAIAGIGHPQRFFDTLTRLGINYRPYAFPDHHVFSEDDLKVAQACILMTEKDAVKCVSFATPTMYYLPVEAVLDESFWDALFVHKQLEGLR